MKKLAQTLHVQWNRWNNKTEKVWHLLVCVFMSLLLSIMFFEIVSICRRHADPNGVLHLLRARKLWKKEKDFFWSYLYSLFTPVNYEKRKMFALVLLLATVHSCYKLYKTRQVSFVLIYRVYTSKLWKKECLFWS